MSSQPTLGRVDSMDQFRGFTVLSMFIVNFAHFQAISPFWKHNDNYVTFADWIMPGFIFAVGFSYRLTILKRLEKFSALTTYSTYFRRSLALILVSLMLYGFGGEFKNWSDFSAEETIQVDDGDSGMMKEVKVRKTTQFIMRLIKSNLWEVLSIIAVCQIFVMPVIAAGPLVRFLAMIGCLVFHMLFSWWFNWGFVHGYEHNWMVQLWETGGNRCWDGGFFGIMSWSVAMLAGSLVYDILATNTRKNAGGKIFLFAAVFMIIGYILSCGTRFYDTPLPAAPEKPAAKKEASEKEGGDKKASDEKAKDQKEKAEPAKAEPAKEEPAKESQAKDKKAEDKKTAGEKATDKKEEGKKEEGKPAKDKKAKGKPGKGKKGKEKKPKPLLKQMEANVPQKPGDVAKYAKDPMIPDFSKAAGRGLSDLLAEPPFVMPPHPDQKSVNDRLKKRDELEAMPELDEKQQKELEQLNRSLLGAQHYEYGRQWNYWMMYKRMVSVSFILFATGVAIAIYALFILLSDINGMHIGVFRTFGMNPLAAYAIHHVVGHSMHNLAPNDSPLWYCWFITFVFMAINYLFVRHLEKHNIFIRL
ncbi:hypothetical protein Pan258_50570 [Symmachiella dynata]|uniref:hypothetical protein n=1 Tax=Symmachiella dynata TaxID=2527995 RepID=UPI001187B0C8|nr:hypothetical protein [Symmachiella dynata]QDT50974.1 hypothetical protein Pan258_50570 [Symmachiella dynata]